MVTLVILIFFTVTFAAGIYIGFGQGIRWSNTEHHRILREKEIGLAQSYHTMGKWRRIAEDLFYDMPSWKRHDNPAAEAFLAQKKRERDTRILHD